LGVPASQNAVGELVEHLDNALHDGKSVAVHCRQGIGRSSLITAAALMAGGMEPARALEAVRRARGVAVPETEPQRRWISEFGDWLAGKRPAQPRRASNER
jgi:protein-tyrosine phosphatase